MSDFAAPIAPAFGPIVIRATPRVDTPDLLPVLKVRTIHAVLVTLLVVTQYWFQLASSLSQQPRLLIEIFFGMFAWNVGNFIIGFAIIALVQTRMPPGRARTIVLLSAIVVWALLWTLWNFLEAGSHFIVVQRGLVSSAGSSLNGLWTTTTYLLLAAWCYESSERARRTRATLRQSELTRRSAEQWLLELRLGALQARVDPQVLFDTLERVGRLYRSLPAAAEQLLDALIAYLRLALPQQQRMESTLGREVALGVAYARLLRAADGEALNLDGDVEPAAGNVRFPPMVVQPLCDALARLTLETGAPARLHISASREGDGARLFVTASPARTTPAGKRLEEIRHILLSMFGPLVRMDATGPTAAVVSVSVEVPYDAAPRFDC